MHSAYCGGPHVHTQQHTQREHTHTAYTQGAHTQPPAPPPTPSHSASVPAQHTHLLCTMEPFTSSIVECCVMVCLGPSRTSSELAMAACRQGSSRCACAMQGRGVASQGWPCTENRRGRTRTKAPSWWRAHTSRVQHLYVLTHTLTSRAQVHAFTRTHKRTHTHKRGTSASTLYFLSS